MIDKAIVFIGRHPDCDVVLTHSRKISRKHCCIAQVNSNYLVRDLGSMNGVYVNGHPVNGLAPLQPGDELGVGDLRYKLTVLKTPPPAKRAKPPLPSDLSQEVPVPIPPVEERFDEVPPDKPLPDSSEELDSPEQDNDLILQDDSSQFRNRDL